MMRSLGGNVPDGDAVLVFMLDCGGDFAVDDFLEDGLVRHGNGGGFAVKKVRSGRWSGKSPRLAPSGWLG